MHFATRRADAAVIQSEHRNAAPAQRVRDLSKESNAARDRNSPAIAQQMNPKSSRMGLTINRFAE